MRIHKVSLEDIDQYKALGFGGLGTEELVRFRIHRVTPAFVREMRDVGFATVTEEQLVRMRIHKVDAQFVKDARADGYAMTTPSDAVDLAIRGPRYTRARKQKSGMESGADARERRNEADEAVPGPSADDRIPA